MAQLRGVAGHEIGNAVGSRVPVGGREVGSVPVEVAREDEVTVGDPYISLICEKEARPFFLL